MIFKMESGVSEVFNGKSRASLFGVAAAYLLYLSYDLFRAGRNADMGMNPLARWFFIVLFAASAVGIGYYAFRIWKQCDREEKEQQLQQEQQEEEDDLS